jgi:hypothetical protein
MCGDRETRDAFDAAALLAACHPPSCVVEGPGAGPVVQVSAPFEREREPLTS